jgi:hypothetical protein
MPPNVGYEIRWNRAHSHIKRSAHPQPGVQGSTLTHNKLLTCGDME